MIVLSISAVSVLIRRGLALSEGFSDAVPTAPESDMLELSLRQAFTKAFGRLWRWETWKRKGLEECTAKEMLVQI